MQDCSTHKRTLSNAGSNPDKGWHYPALLRILKQFAIDSNAYVDSAVNGYRQTFCNDGVNDWLGQPRLDILQSCRNPASIGLRMSSSKVWVLSGHQYSHLKSPTLILYCSVYLYYCNVRIRRASDYLFTSTSVVTFRFVIWNVWCHRKNVCNFEVYSNFHQFWQFNSW